VRRGGHVLGLYFLRTTQWSVRQGITYPSERRSRRKLKCVGAEGVQEGKDKRVLEICLLRGRPKQFRRSGQADQHSPSASLPIIVCAPIFPSRRALTDDASISATAAGPDKVRREREGRKRARPFQV
jgi:hypothetical protein